MCNQITLRVPHIFHVLRRPGGFGDAGESSSSACFGPDSNFWAEPERRDKTTSDSQTDFKTSWHSWALKLCEIEDGSLRQCFWTAYLGQQFVT